MSYSCEISFKQLAGDDVYAFLQGFKKQAIAHFSDIAKENLHFSPIMRAWPCEGPLVVSREHRDATVNWAKRSIFTYRYFYNSKLQLLGVYSVSKSLQELFDATIHFQNSCDQDYDFETWQGVPYFESVAEKWKSTSDKEMIQWFERELERTWDPNEPYTDLVYCRKWAVYREIWDNFEETLFNDDFVVYVSLFGYYDLLHMECFCSHIEHHAKAQIEEWKQKITQGETAK